MRPLACLLLVAASCAGAIEPRDARGLDVRLEALPEPVTVDGVVFEIQFASGRDIQELARRMEHRWRQQGSLVQRLQQRGWQLLSRWEEGRSELLQWQGEGAGAQLVFSRLDTTRAPARPGRGPLVLPARCAWGRLIQDRSQALRTAACRLTLPELQLQLRARLVAQGWSVRQETGVTFEVSRAGQSARLTLSAGSQAGESALVWAGQGAPSAESPR